MRILMLGTGPFAVPTFQALLAAHDVPALITRPTPPPRGRVKQAVNPMRDVAEARGLPIHAPDSINTPEAVELLRSYSPELLVVCDYGQILSPAALAAAPLGGINLHASLLPKYRGAAPINWAILQGDTETGVTVIHMTPRLDGGPCLAIRRTPIGPTETTAELEPRLATLGVDAVNESLALLANWDRVSQLGELQDQSAVTKAPRLTKDHARVNWTKSAKTIADQVRGLKPWPGTYSHWLRSNGEPLRLILDQVTVAPGEGEPGTVLNSSPGKLVIACGQDALSLDLVQPAGKRVLPVAEFLRGYPIKPGEHFGDPPAEITA